MAAFTNEEHVSILIGDEWHRGVIKRYLSHDRYEVVLKTQEGKEEPERLTVNGRAIVRRQIWVCSGCGNWIDPDKLQDPAPISPDGRRAQAGRGPRKAAGKQILLRVTPRCDHGVKTPFIIGTMVLIPWTEVEGVTAIGGLQSSGVK